VCKNRGRNGGAGARVRRAKERRGGGRSTRGAVEEGDPGGRQWPGMVEAGCCRPKEGVALGGPVGTVLRGPAEEGWLLGHCHGPGLVNSAISKLFENFQIDLN
jgi:hypothetical protein